jgi:NADPH:quinone reductase-like Zn-dependent oxidoreductase
MRAFTVPEFNQQGAVAEVRRPDPGEGQILVRVSAAGVNPMDTILVRGWAVNFGEHRKPLVPGFDYAGVVEAVGPGVTGIGVGDRVFGAVGKRVFGEGSWAEYVTASAALAHPIPEALTFEQAAAIPLAGGTALAMLDAADVRAGQTVLVVGAAGGVGSYAVQLAKRAGATVFAATREASRDHVRGLGADEVLDADADVAAQVRALAPVGVDVLIDTYHDADGLAGLARTLKGGGWIVSATARGAEDVLAEQPVRVAIVNAALDRVGELAQLVASGQVRLPIETVSLQDAGRALAEIGSARVRGKQVVTID